MECVMRKINQFNQKHIIEADVRRPDKYFAKPISL